MILDRGNLFVIAAPSGTGKTTLVKSLVESMSGIMVSISHTTRQKRPAEMDGINYHFISDSIFHQMIDRGEFLEYAKVFKHLYGTSRAWVEETLDRGIDVILEIDWQGSQQIRKIFPDCITLFILPPSLDALHNRLIQRNQDTAEVIQQRLADAKETLNHIDEFDYLVVNDNFQTALENLQSILHAARLREPRQKIKLSKLLSEFC